MDRITVGAKVSPEVKRAAHAEAKKAGMTFSAWLRWQLRELTDKQPRPLDEIREESDPDPVEA